MRVPRQKTSTGAAFCGADFSHCGVAGCAAAGSQGAAVRRSGAFGGSSTWRRGTEDRQKCRRTRGPNDSLPPSPGVRRFGRKFFDCAGNPSISQEILQFRRQGPTRDWRHSGAGCCPGCPNRAESPPCPAQALLPLPA